jgi:hypothetical protein
LVDLMQRIAAFPCDRGRRLVGIVSIGDVVKSRLEEMERESNELREYIRSA